MSAAASASRTTAGRCSTLANTSGRIVEAVRPTGLPIVIEPGRSIVGPAGALLARVIDLKPRNAISEFAVIDAGMTELMRPALYSAFHRIERVAASDDEPRALRNRRPGVREQRRGWP